MAMGTTFTSNYSGVFLGNFENTTLSNAPNNPSFGIAYNPLFGYEVVYERCTLICETVKELLEMKRCSVLCADKPFR